MKKDGITMNQIYSKNSYHIYKASSGYIVYNTNKEFQDGHTHLNSFKSAKYLIDLSLHKSIPFHLDRYRLLSLSRITDDESYRTKIMDLLTNKKSKMSYINCNRKCS